MTHNLPRRSQILQAFGLAACLVFAFSSCKLDMNALRQDTLSRIKGAERIFFLENVASSDIQNELSPIAREAARFGYVQVLRYLQSRGADLNQADEYGWSPILIAASNGDLQLIRYLVEIAGADVRAKTRTKTTTLMLAARTGNIDLCRYLLDRGTNVDAKSIHGMTALMYAAATGKTDLTQLLVERGADIQVTDSYSNTALAFATTNPMQEYLKTIGLKETK